MATDATVEGRLEAVEMALEELRRLVEMPSKGTGWLDQVVGIFEDEPAFDEVIRLGREFRLSDRPADGPAS